MKARIIYNAYTLVHNRYQSQSPSGENIVFDDECLLLREHENEVIIYERKSDDIKSLSLVYKLFLPTQTIWSRKSYQEICKLIQSKKPQVAHIHNTFPLISPSVYYACQSENVPVIQTLHNFRFFCAPGVFFRNNHICEECLHYNAFRAFKYGCYRNSKIKSLPVSAMIWFHDIRNTWLDQIDIFIALTEFARKKYIEQDYLLIELLLSLTH